MRRATEQAKKRRDPTAPAVTSLSGGEQPRFESERLRFQPLRQLALGNELDLWATESPSYDAKGKARICHCQTVLRRRNDERWLRASYPFDFDTEAPRSLFAVQVVAALETFNGLDLPTLSLKVLFGSGDSCCFNPMVLLRGSEASTKSGCYELLLFLRGYLIGRDPWVQG